MLAALRATDRSYPRVGEPIVPRLLRGLVLERRVAATHTDEEADMLARMDLGPAVWKRLPPETCRRLSLTVVDRVRTRLSGISSSLRATPLPDPTATLALPLEQRTINAIRRGIGRRPAPGPWTVERYLEIRRFGARALIDLLACLEVRDASERLEAIPPAAPTGPGTSSESSLARVLTAVSRRLPGSEAGITHQLIADGSIANPVDLARLLRRAVELGWDVPFRQVTIGGSRMLVRLADVSAARAAYRIAARAIQDRGATTVADVVGRLRAATDSAFDHISVQRLLTGVSGFRWLSRDEGWFFFAGRSNPLVVAVRKVMSVTRRITILRLWCALQRIRAELSGSRKIVATIAAETGETRMVDDDVLVDECLDPDRHLSEAEKKVLGLMSALGRPSSDRELRLLARRAGLPWSRVQRVLSESPIVEQSAGGLYHPIGWLAFAAAFGL
jgi:hypothetical protein